MIFIALWMPECIGSFFYRFLKEKEKKNKAISMKSKFTEIFHLPSWYEASRWISLSPNRTLERLLWQLRFWHIGFVCPFP
jgi:hypothetical protein